MTQPPRVLIVTNSYPGAGTAEKGFLLEDIKAMMATGMALTLAPIRRFKEVDRDLPPGVAVTLAYAEAFSVPGVAASALRLLVIPDFWRELRRQPGLLLRKRFWQEALRLSVARRVLGAMRGDFDLFYTHWFTADTIGLAHVGARPLVTRVHGYDLYEEVDANAGYIPFRRDCVDRIDRIVTLSRQARTYALQRYGVAADKVVRFPLGVADQEDVNSGGDVGSTIVFASCSFPVAVKRLSLIFAFVRTFAAKHPHLRVVWHHLGAHEQELGSPGDGPLPANLVVKAWGPVGRDEVLEFYRRTDVAFFVNLSASEGMPVSVMEAMSFGIPVIGTAVGGVPEMLEGGAGLVVPADADADEIATVVSAAMSDPGWRGRLGAAARARQRGNFSGQHNAERFAAFMLALAAS